MHYRSTSPVGSPEPPLVSSRRSDGRLGRRSRRLGRLLGRGRGALSEGLIMMVLTTHRVPEVAQTASERPSDLREPLRTEHQQRDHENEKEMGWLKDVANHKTKG
jgi:hypothetical protein